MRGDSDYQRLAKQERSHHVRSLFYHRSLNTFHAFHVSCGLLNSESSAVSPPPLEDQPCSMSLISLLLKLIGKTQQSKMTYHTHCNWILDFVRQSSHTDSSVVEHWRGVGSAPSSLCLRTMTKVPDKLFNLFPVFQGSLWSTCDNFCPHSGVTTVCFSNVAENCSCVTLVRL